MSRVFRGAFGIALRTYQDVRDRLVNEGYEDVIHTDGDDEVIEMHGIALQQVKNDIVQGPGVQSQPDPMPTSSQPIWEMVIVDMQERDQHGRRLYGTPLQAHNGRDPLIEAYQEALDLAVYLRQAIEESKNA